MNGANIVSLEDSESRIQLESILKSGDQILIHSAVTKESFYIKNKEYMAIVSPQPLTLTVK
jgi:hypothetical protein